MYLYANGKPQELDGDVYKRQVIFRMYNEGMAYRFCGNLPEQDSLIVVDEEASFNPVSYTHLDVYKRQIVRRQLQILMQKV